MYPDVVYETFFFLWWQLNFSFAHNPVLLIAQLRRRVETPKGNEFRLGELQFTGLLAGKLAIKELL